MKVLQTPFNKLGPVAIDFEAYDPDLKTLGSDAYSAIRDGYPYCLSLYNPDIGKVYLDDTMLEWDEVDAWIAEGLKAGGCHLIGANIKYELGWLHWMDCWEPKDLKNNLFSCVIVRAALINSVDRHLLNLEGQAQVYGLPGKTMDILEAEAQRLGIRKKVRHQHIYENMHRFDRKIVREYNEHDAYLAYEVYQKQEPVIEAEGLRGIWEIEQKNTPVLAAMESKGLRIDLKKLDSLEETVEKRLKDLKSRVDKAAGEEISPNPSHSLYRAVEKHEIPLPKTDTGKPKTDKKSLEKHLDNPFVKDILEYRKLTKLLGTFIQGAIRKNLVVDRIYVTMNQLASDDKGTITGRLSCSNPNGQQIPKRDEEWGPLMRGLFIPEEGYQYLSADFSKQEPRLVAHFAALWPGITGGRAIAKAFIDNPDLDPHSLVAEWAGLEEILPEKIAYAAGKQMNLGLSYGMQSTSLGINLMALGVPENKVKEVERRYHQAFPHIRSCSTHASMAAERWGVVRTIKGRKYRFDLYVPMNDWKAKPLPYNKCKEVYKLEEKGIAARRAGTHKSFNSIIQGSAADQTKIAMNVLFYIYDIVPNLQVHDELNDSEGTPEKAVIYEKVMREAVKLLVPVKVTVTLGDSWAG